MSNLVQYSSVAAIYDLATGEILRFVSGPPETLPLQASEGQGWLNTTSVQKDVFVKDGQIVSRPRCTATLDGMVLKGLPVPCTVTIGDDVHTVTEGSGEGVELEFGYPGTYTVSVTAWPYLEKKFTVVQE
jgi:hypothetical protein